MAESSANYGPPGVGERRKVASERARYASLRPRKSPSAVALIRRVSNPTTQSPVRGSRHFSDGDMGDRIASITLR